MKFGLIGPALAIAIFLPTSSAFSQGPCSDPCRFSGSQVQNNTLITFHLDMGDTGGEKTAWRQAMAMWETQLTTNGINVDLREGTYFRVYFDNTLVGSGTWGLTNFSARTIRLNPELILIGGSSLVTHNALHEIGHVLAANHSPCGAPSSVMGSLSSSQASSGQYATSLTSADRCSLNYIYYTRPTCPLLLDTAGDGIALSPPMVLFAMDAQEGPEVLAWTWPGSDDAFLVYDRNDNNAVDDGSELFGNATPLSCCDWILANDGVQALTSFDSWAAGGDEDGAITDNDAIFRSLRLWIDEDSNGRSEPRELKSLRQVGVSQIGLAAEPISETDAYGNVAFLRGTFLIGRRSLSTYQWMDFFLAVTH